jgi:prolyl 4-hydroxylase
MFRRIIVKTSFDKGWLDWIASNIKRDCDRDEMYSILVANDFCPELVKNHLHFEKQNLSTVSPIVDKTNVSANKARQSFCQPTQGGDNNEGIYLANAEKIDTNRKLELFKIDNFLSAQECVELLTVIRGSLRESTITNKSGTLKNYRTSKTCDLSLLNHPLVNDIDQRICNTLGFNASYSEPIQAQWYNKNQEFKPHTDYFEPNSKEFDLHAKVRGQRTWTFMIYLNNTLAGGATEFIRVNKAFSPKRGRAVIWNSLTVEDKENIESMHCGSPVEDGFKVIITKWFRLKGQGIRYTKEPNEYLPSYTDEGFFRSKLPETLFKKIYGFYQSYASKVLSNEEITLSENLQKDVQQLLQPLVEAWFGHYLKLSQISGINRYNKGSIIMPYRQDPSTSIVCVVVNVQQMGKYAWPMIISDHNYRQHQLELKPGDMIFYEAAKLKCGRPLPFNGEEFADICLHYQLS